MRNKNPDWINSVLWPLIISGGLIIAYWLQINANLNVSVLGIQPLYLKAVSGIFTAPLAHGSPAHLFSNVTTLFALLVLLFIYYPRQRWLVLFSSWLLTGVLMFLIARPGVVHIGASGVVYALLAFLILAGWLSGNRAQRVLSMLLILYYGSLVWGVFPIENGVSWDGHLSGLITGLTIALLLWRRMRRQYADPEPDWEEDTREDPYRPFDEDE